MHTYYRPKSSSVTHKDAYNESPAPVSTVTHVQRTTCVVMSPAGNCLQRLDLSDNPMTGDVADSLAEMLKGQPHLRALNLNDTSLEDAGVSTIAQALAQSGTLPSPLPCHQQLMTSQAGCG